MRRIVTLFLLIYAFGVLAITGVHIVARRQPAESGWIAYHAESGDVIVVRRDGKFPKQVNPVYMGISNFEWSNDGQSLFVTAIPDPNPPFQMSAFRIYLNTEKVEQLTFFEENSQVDSLQVSPDGERIYYSLRSDNGMNNCYRGYLGALTFNPLTTFDIREDQKAVSRCWISPNEQLLVVAIFDASTQRTGLYLFNIETQSQFMLAEDFNRLVGNTPALSWSPDSQQLLLSGQYEGEPIRVLSIANLDDGTPLFPRRRYLQQGSAIWSPDGEWIAFLGRRQNKIMLYQVRADGSDEKILYETIANGTEPQWSANGRWLAMGVSRATNNPSETLDLMIFEADGSAPPKIIADDVIPYGQVAWSPPLDKAWSPNAFLIGGVACILMACVGQYIANHPRR